MKIALINSSPKLKNSNTALVLSDLKHYLNPDIELLEYSLNFKSDFEVLLNTVKNCDAWIFAYPLYVDNLPSHLLSFLEFIEDKKLSIGKKSVYAIANCGFFEGIQNDLTLEVFENWCKKVDFFYKGGVGIGGGEAFSCLKSIPVGYGPKASIDNALRKLSNAVATLSKIDNQFVNLNYPRFLYQLGAQGRWKREIKENGFKVKDLDRKLN